MKMKMKIMMLLLMFAVTVVNFSCSQKTSMKALIVTGQNSHQWQSSSLALRSILEKSGLFTAEIIVSPRTGEDMSEFIIDFNQFDVVVLDYNGDDWPAATRNNFVSYVQNGGGVVVFNAANSAFPDWPEYNEIIGVGGWGMRNEKSGPYLYIEDGRVVRDNSPGRSGAQSRQHEFVVQAFKPEHPILKGLPEKWMHAQDELYSELRGPAKNLEVLAYAHSDKELGGTGLNEPVLMTITYGKGRVFHTVLGHVGEGDLFYQSMECAGFVTTLQRGAEWAATGEVTQEAPSVFPTETQSLRWAFFEDIYSDITPIIRKMKEYEIGKSNESFIILKKLIRENIDNLEKMDDYHRIILQLLKSQDSTPECKKVLLKEFSWIANDSYKEVYEELIQNPKISDEAQYALEMIGN